jgi:phage protein D
VGLMDLLGGGAPPGMRRPVFEVAFAGGGGGGLGGLASAAGSLLGGGGGDPWAQSLVSVTVETGLAPSVDTAEIVIAPGPDAPTVVVGDEGTVKLGYEDDAAELVFTGKVESVRTRIGGPTRIVASNGGAALSRLRVNAAYDGEAAGGVVSDLAGRAEVDTDSVEDGIALAYFVVDDRTSAWGHVARLARASGHLAYFTPEGALYFAPFAEGSPAGSFGYGVDLLAFEATEAVPSVGKVTAVGEGAAGSQGQDASTWLLKDAEPVTRSAGEGEGERLLAEGAVRSGDAATTLAESVALAASREKLTGRLLVPGAAKVAVGSTVEVKDAPQEALNGSFLVRRVRHRYTKRDGFTTLIDVSAAGSAGGLGGLAGGLP